ncbi:hypothetical protein CHUAL_005542 [Chamberlinius hualienensis]
MLGISYVIWSLIVIIVVIIWGLPKIISWLLCRILDADVKVGRLSLIPLCLRDIHICKHSCTVIIDSIGVSSNLVNSNYRKILAIYVSDVRIEKEVSSFSDVPEEEECQTKTTKPTSGKFTIPQQIVSLSQVTSIHVYNTNIMLIKLLQKCLLHTTVKEFEIQGIADQNPSCLQASLTVNQFMCKVLHHVKESTAQSCLSEIGFGCNVLLSIDPKNGLDFKSLSINIQPEMDVFLSEGLFRFLVLNKKPSTSAKTEISNAGMELMWHRLPKVFNFNMESSHVKILSEDSQHFFSLTAKKLAFDWSRSNIASQVDDLDFRSNFLLEDVNLSSGIKRMATLSRVECKLTISPQLFEVFAIVSTFSCLYYHDGIIRFIESISKWRSLKSSSKIASSPITSSASTSNSLSIFDQVLANRERKITLEVWNVVTIFNLQLNSSFGIGFTHARLASERTAITKDSSTDLYNYNGLLESWWCHIGEQPLPDNPNKKHHYWNTPIFVGVILFEAKQKAPSNGYKIESMIDCLHLEWNPSLQNLLLQIHKCIHQMKAITGSKQLSQSEETPASSRKSLAISKENVHVALTNTNIFASCAEKVIFLLRADSGNLETQSDGLNLSAEGTKLVQVTANAPHFPCNKSTELKQAICQMETCYVSYRQTNNKLSVIIKQQMFFEWTTTIHMAAYSILSDIQAVKSQIVPTKLSQGSAPTAAPRRGRKINVNLSVNGQMDLTVCLSSRHTMKLKSQQFCLDSTQKSIKLTSDETVLELDDHHVITLIKPEISSVPNTREERQSFEILQTKENNAWNIKFPSVNIRFPHEYNFAEAFSEEAISIMKWLKVVHKMKKSEDETLNSLPPDLYFKIYDICIEICDDPFEIKLRDNYELLEDEFHESEKRMNMLNAKVEELRKTHLYLPAAKVEELYKNLVERNANIYIKRSRQLYSSGSSRTQLFLARGSNIEIVALADISMLGRDNIVTHMRNMDPDSQWPDEEPSFTTLWCRMVQFSASNMTWHLRDYPLPVLSAKGFIAWGKLVGAEEAPSNRGKRIVTVEVGLPWGNDNVERSLQPLKFYHDFSCDVDNLTLRHGPCLEPCMAEYGLALDLISKPSADPSPPLPFWDKIRFLFHGRLTMLVQKLTMVLHSSLNPYNTTEEMDFTWTDLAFDWTNSRFVLKGNLDIYVRTASKYDDCHLMHFPMLKLNVKLDWQCLGDPNDHHTVKPCAPDKIPEYSSNQKHDSYRAFRSNNLNLAVSMDVKTNTETGDIPCMLFYNNTLKWLENLKVILSGVTRPIRRGPVFGHQKPRKITLSRHYKSIRFSVSLQQFEICYWMSFAKQRGFRLQAKKLSLSSEYNLALMPVLDGLKHRPQAVYSVVYLNCELNDGETWLQSTTSEENGSEMNVSFRAPVEKSYLLSVSKLSYGREASSGRTIGSGQDVPDTPHHRLVVHDLKGSWTKTNRTIVFTLFDSFNKIKLLRHNLSTEALKGFRNDQKSSSPLKRGSSSTTTASSPLTSGSTAANTTSPLSRIQSGLAITMLQKLIAETDKNVVVFSEDLSGTVKEQVLHGVASCQTDDVLYRNWLIELSNCQVLLRGCESPGYVIMSAARAQILQRIHQPVWKDRTLVSKTTWVGSFECMQYYGTIEQGSLDNIHWLSLENIEEKESTVISNLVDLVGSGRGVGGVVSDTVGVGGISENNSGVQLQRIVSRCGCQFFYASYGDGLDPNTFEQIPPIPPEDSEIWKQDVAVDSFTLTHHDLNCCTNSVQYSMLLDIVNNLLLYVEPGKKEALERLQRLQFQIQLSSMEDQKKPILLLQNNLRLLMSSLRRLEKEIYMVQKSLDSTPHDESLFKQMEYLENQVYDTKVQINSQADELAVMISCFKEKQMLANRNLKTTKNQQVPLRRRIEVCFRYAQWRLTEADGQLGIADVVLNNFLYSKDMKVDDSAEHLLELGYLKVSNGLPNQIYKDVLQPTELKGNIPIDRQCALRMFCREKAPVGGISIKEHFEVNIVPMTLKVTHQFFTTMMKFCFQERASNTDTGISGGGDCQEDFDPETASLASSGSGSGIRSSKKKLQAQRRMQSAEDDIEKMKERAEKNKMFLYIKIPEVPVRVSYKGEKEKNIEDVHDFGLVVPTLEYHNVTWTWLDLLLAMKNDSRKALLSQAIKHKLQIKSRISSDEDGTLTPQEEDKARLLLGNLLTGNVEKSKKHSVFGKLYKTDPKPF